MARKQRIDLGRYVTLDTEQTIKGKKIFSENANPLEINSVLNEALGRFMIKGQNKGSVGYSEDTGVYLYRNDASDLKKTRLIGVDNEGIPIYGRPSMGIKEVLIHTGNLSQYINASAIKTATATVQQQVQLNNDNDMKDNAIKLGGGRHSATRPYPRWLAMRRCGAERRAA